MDYPHEPVLLAEVLEALNLRPGDRVVDGCLGLAGYACAFLDRIRPDGFLLGTDLDQELIAQARARLSERGGRFELVHSNYADLPEVLARLQIERVAAVGLDLGVCSQHFDLGPRGFSVWRDGPLDMRFDRGQELTAATIVNHWPQERIAHILWDCGEERQARRIARAIVARRRAGPLTTTGQLAALVEQVKGRSRKGAHAAVKTFQGLRVTVNAELENLERFLEAAPDILAPGGRVAVIGYHSKEDRLVKTAFRRGRQQGLYAEVTRKPIVPSPEEVAANPRARSAKLRCAVRAG